MPSPFLGMDPYLEAPQHWGSVHDRMTAAIEAQLNQKLPRGFVAELDQYVWLTTEPPGQRELLGRPDAFVTPRRRYPADEEGGGVAPAVETAVLAEPTLRTKLPKSRKSRRSFVKITTADGSELLTVVELLSPANKTPGDDSTTYLAKRGEYLAAKVNLVEIDLLRAGSQMPMDRPEPPATDYYAVICPAEQPGAAAVWAFSVREKLPVLPVPYKSGLLPVALDLRACLDRAYDDGRYRNKLRYDGHAEPPLRRDDAEWAEGGSKFL